MGVCLLRGPPLRPVQGYSYNLESLVCLSAGEGGRVASRRWAAQASIKNTYVPLRRAPN